MSGTVAVLTAPNGVQITLPTGLFINNEHVSSSSGSTILAIDPRYERLHPNNTCITAEAWPSVLKDRSDESEITAVASASREDVDRAVKAAREALKHPDWAEMSPTDRGLMLFRLADLVEANKEALATLETWNNGKPYNVSLTEDVPEVVSTLRYYAGWADKIHGQTIPTTSKKLAYTLKQPVGVCAQIIPWNYPLSMAAWKLGPALACGNTVVLKPSEQTPLSILLLSTFMQQAGFPPGVVNIINGLGADAGDALVSHPGVDKVAFTGSTTTGRLIMQRASGNLKNITLETGGKSPLLVFKDADLQQAVRWGHIGIMSNQGQICSATSRILVQEEIYEEYLAQFREVCLSHKVGSPWDADTFQGPQVSKAQYDRILDYIEAGKTAGATLVAGGCPYKNVLDGKGFYLEPTIFSDVTPDMKIFQEEVFGPFVTITPFKTEEDGAHLANDSCYGLGAAIFTKDLQRAHRVAGRVDAGMVWVNSSNDADFRVPFGGVKQSGIGRELGEAGLVGYLQTKAIHVNLGLKL